MFRQPTKVTVPSNNLAFLCILATESQQVFDCTPEQLESQMMDLFLRFCHFERSAGYTERAVALLQVIVPLLDIHYSLFPRICYSQSSTLHVHTP